ncbi:MAG: hypothetical protein ACREKK_01420 [Candidatus Methylomirabilales bacterium]
MTEWTSGIGEQPQVPTEYRDRMRYRFAVYFGQDQRAIRGQCAGYQVHPVGHVLELQEVLADTSEEFQGTILAGRVTYQPKMFFLGAAALLIPLRKPETSGATG